MCKQHACVRQPETIDLTETMKVTDSGTWRRLSRLVIGLRREYPLVSWTLVLTWKGCGWVKPLCLPFSGGKVEGRLSSRHRLCPGLQLHAVRSLWGDQKPPATSDPSTGQRLHGDVAKGCGLSTPKQHHASGECLCVENVVVRFFSW